MMLSHYAMVKFSQNTPAGHIEAFKEKMKALEKMLPDMKEFVFGIDEFREARSWDVIIFMKFQTREQLRHYQEHEEHLRIIEFNKPYIENIASVDFMD